MEKETMTTRYETKRPESIAQFHRLSVRSHLLSQVSGSPTRTIYGAMLNRVHIDHIDGTPAGYALRILEYYRLRCNEKWEVHGLSAKETAVYDMMNQHQQDRAVELDRAIVMLKEGVKAQ